MASTKLTCPECEAVLRPSKPVAPGKKVKCPKCETVFSAPRDADGEPGAVKKPAPQAAKPAADDDDEGGTYGYVKDPDEADESKKPKIEYGPDTSITDPRGPAIVKLAGPSSKLQLAGLLGCIGWVAYTILIIFPAAFPINPDVRVYAQAKPPQPAGMGGMPGMAAAQQNPDGAKSTGPPAPPFFLVYGIDFYQVIDLPWYWFLPALVPFLLMALCSAIIVGGGIQMQTLESRQFGFIGAALALLPINTAGLGFTLAVVIHWLCWQVLEENETGTYVSAGVNVLLWLGSAFAGGWSLMTLLDEEVVEGFEFVPQK